MIIKFERPPNYDAICAVFDLKNYQPIFAYNPWIYNPNSVVIDPFLIPHEEVHGRRQGDDPAAWWERYLSDENFRLAEEVLAHVAEYQFRIQGLGRPGRRAMVHETTDRLRSPLYAYKPSLSYDRAKGLLKWALKEARENRHDAT